MINTKRFYFILVFLVFPFSVLLFFGFVLFAFFFFIFKQQLV